CLAKQSVDVRWFTSRQAVQDVEFVRQALGYGQIDVMGVSYGTRVAQLVLRKYPDKVRSIVIDGILPPQVVLGPEFADNLAISLQKLFLRCAADSYCTKAFAGLEQDWKGYLQQPIDAQREFRLTHPRTGKPLDLKVSRQGMDAAVRLLSYASETRALLPLLIHETAQGDWQGLLGQALRVTDGMEKEMALGMHNSVVCSEDVPFYTEGESGDNRVLGHMVHQLRLICSEWPRGESYADIHQPLESDTPALLLSGELDPVTPIRYGELALKQFSRGRHLVVPGQGHNVSPRGCVPELVADFLETLELDEEKAACVQDIPRLPFFIDKLGPGA
ncbi:alpha/beta hydrolase, partial [Thiolapillus sp.]